MKPRLPALLLTCLLPGGAWANTFIAGDACPGDTRHAVTETGMPWRCIGKLSLPNHRFMTATLVGPNLILTAAHGLVHDGKLRPGRFIFHPDFGGRHGQSGDSATVTRFWLGSFTPQRNECRHADWAILQLDRNLGDAYGTLPVVDAEAATLARQAPRCFLVAYDRDFRHGAIPAWQAGCGFVSLDPDGYLLHDFSTATGASGAPIFTRSDSLLHPGVRIVALNVAEKSAGHETLFDVPFSEGVANVAIASHEFYRTLGDLLGGRPAVAGN